MHKRKTLTVAMVIALAASLFSVTLVSAYDPGPCPDGAICENPPPEEPPTGGEGCTPGYWKNHTDNWPDVSAPESHMLLEWLSAKRKDYGEKAALLRHAVAALLNAIHPDVNYYYTPQQVFDMVHNAVDFEATKNLFETQNEMGCPLN